MKIILLKGLPASGKSTYARKLVEKGNHVRINFDDLRSMMHNGRWSKGREKLTQKVAYDIAAETLERGQNVIWDNTSFAPKHEARLSQLAKEYGVELEVKFFDVNPEVAIKRDLARPNSVGPDVIWDMYYRYVWEAPPAQDNTLPEAVVFDVDGTLALNDGHRGWFDWGKVSGDSCVEEVAHLASMYAGEGYHIVVVTGRDGEAYDDTYQWLKDHDIDFDELWSRAKGDNRSDTIVKREIYESEIKPRFNVKLVIDDRESVVRMWGDELGIKVLQARHPGKKANF